MIETLQHPDRIDVVTLHPESKEYALIVSAQGHWEGSEGESSQFLRKLNAYLHFLFNGGMSARYPQSEALPKRIQIDTSEPLPDRVQLLLKQLQGPLLDRGVTLSVNEG